MDPRAPTRSFSRRDGGAPSTSDLAVEAVGLRKSFGNEVALDGLDLAVAEGTVLALIGPNGSGKTTTVRVLSTLLAADAGRAAVADHDVAKDPGAVRAAIGITGQFSAIDKLLTGRENLVLMADLHHLGRRRGRERAGELLERFELTDAADRPVATYSGGMTRRLDLAMTLMGSPRGAKRSEPSWPGGSAPPRWRRRARRSSCAACAPQGWQLGPATPKATAGS